MSTDSTCPKGSTVLVTGANGFIATHIVDQLLLQGYKVRGTVRDAETATYLTKIFHQRRDPDLFTTVIVPDIAAPNACDDAMVGCTGVVHTATNMSMKPDLDIISSTVDGLKNMLESAARTPSIVRFVYTCTCNAGAEPGPNRRYHIDSNSFNYLSSRKARQPPPHPLNQGFIVYSAAKAEAEQFAWKYMRETQPKFIFNVVLPNLSLGPILTPEKPRGGAWLKALYNGAPQLVELFSNEEFWAPGQCNDVRDTARLHVLALREEDVQNERLFSTYHGYSYNELIRMMKSVAPEGTTTIPAEKEGLAENGQTIDEKRSLELLARMGQNGWASATNAMKELLFGEEKAV